ncbi:MAG TPA: helicase HerA-like domain-containing protein, partial [Nitrospira sp.]|nr:helicase HerA-like domain-containing protein [Nitrospira sp.]
MTDGILDGYETDCQFVAYLGTDRLSGEMVQMPISRFNRHGLVAGATGTGKSRSIQQIAEWCSQAGVPVLLCDGKGDMSGLAREGNPSDKARKRMELTGQDTWWEGNSFPVQFLAPGGQGNGVPVRVTVGSFQYKSLAKIIGLTPAQTNALGSVFMYARRAKAELETIEDLQQYVRLVRDDPESSISSGVCNRIYDALNLFEENNPGLFGGPEFDVMDLLKVSSSGEHVWGNVSIIDSSQLVDNPDVLTTFLLWLMAQLNSALPEVGDQDKPRLVFFFDEAHMMFQDAPKEFTRGIVRLVKSIRSKGVGIFFISQSGADIPDAVLAQCGNRIQHTLRANTPAQLRDLKKTADTFPISSRYDIA